MIIINRHLRLIDRIDDDDDDDETADDTFQIHGTRYKHKSPAADTLLGTSYIDNEDNWAKLRWQIILAASALPKEWFEEGSNIFIHPIKLWIDGTCLFNKHATKIGLSIL